MPITRQLISEHKHLHIPIDDSVWGEMDVFLWEVLEELPLGSVYLRKTRFDRQQETWNTDAAQFPTGDLNSLEPIDAIRAELKVLGFSDLIIEEFLDAFRELSANFKFRLYRATST